MKSDLNHILAHYCISCLIPMRTSKVVEVAAGRMQTTQVDSEHMETYSWMWSGCGKYESLCQLRSAGPKPGE